MWLNRFLVYCLQSPATARPVGFSLPLSLEAEAGDLLASLREQKSQAFCIKNVRDTVVTRPPALSCQLPPGMLCPYPMSPPETLNADYSL